jgi:hypothetical protein
MMESPPPREKTTMTVGATNSQRVAYQIQIAADATHRATYSLREPVAACAVASVPSWCSTNRIVTIAGALPVSGSLKLVHAPSCVCAHASNQLVPSL